MSFVQEFNNLPFEELKQQAEHATPSQVEDALSRGPSGLRDFASMISPSGSAFLERLCQRSQALTQQRFGKVIRFFAPLYLSNECINTCKYCGFSRDNLILRVTLSPEEVLREALCLREMGFRNVLLVAGEHPKFVSNGYLARCVEILRPFIPGLSLEVGPMETAEYVPLVSSGAEGLVVYQETYDRLIYSEMHTAGPKKDFDWRLETPERAYAAGFRRIGIGALLGLGDWRHEALAVAAHALFLLKHCWKAHITISFPRLRPSAGEFKPLSPISDRELVQLIAAFRLLLPDVGIVLSTREPAHLRNGLIPLGVTMVSAGSHTEPGGYTGAGNEKVRRTQRGRVVSEENEGQQAPAGRTLATGQFDIADERSATEMAQLITRLGYEPVWKDWDQAFAPVI